MDDVVVVVIAYDWPSNDGGGRIATKSLINQLLRVFPHIHFIGLVDRAFSQENEWNSTQVEFTHILVDRKAPWKRFLKSLTNPLPAITMQFTSKDIGEKLLFLLEKHYKQNQEIIIVFEDIHTACLLPKIKQQFPKIPIVIRSENLTVKAFESFCYKGNMLNRKAWQTEVSKITRFETQVCQTADRVWAITENDAIGYRDELGIQCDGVFGVSLNVDRYANVLQGDPFTVVYIGSTDLRKSQGLWQFVEYSWREIREAVPQARFLLAGNNTEQFTNETEGILGYGYCENELDFLGKGAIFLNPQEDGAGIKLKSIVAMLSGKALVSTEIGIEGIMGNRGEHFLVGQDTKGMAPFITELMTNQNKMINIQKSARTLAREEYNDEKLWQNVQPLLIDMAMLIK